VLAIRRAGAVPAFSGMNLFRHYMQMIMPGANCRSIARGRDLGDALKEDEGSQTTKDPGRNLAWLLKKAGI